MADLDFNDMTFVNNNESTEHQHRKSVREKDMRRRMKLLKEEEEVFGPTFSFSKQNSKIQDERSDLSPNRSLFASSGCSTERQASITSAFNKMNKPNRSEPSSNSLISESLAETAPSLRSSSASELDTPRAGSFLERISHHKSLRDQHRGNVSAMNTPLPHDYLRELIETGIFDSIDEPFINLIKRKQMLQGLPQQNTTDVCEDQGTQCSTTSTEMRKHNHYRASVLSGAERRSEYFWRHEEAPREDLRTDMKYICRNAARVKNRTDSPENPLNYRIGKEPNILNIESLQDSEFRVDAENQVGRDAPAAASPERMQSYTAPPIEMMCDTGRSWSHLGESSHLQTAIVTPLDGLSERHYIQPFSEEIPTQRQAHQSWDWDWDSWKDSAPDGRRSVDTGLPPTDNNEKHYTETLDDLMKRMDREILEGPLSSQKAQEYDGHNDTGYAAPQGSYMKELPRKDWTETYDNGAAQGQHVQRRSSVYHQDNTLDSTRDALEWTDFWRPQCF